MRFHGLHVVAIAAVSMTLPFDQTTSWWAGIDSSMATVFGLVPDWRLIALTVLSGLIASVVLGGRFIAELITSITKDQAGVQGVLSATSRHIGWLERAIVMFLILIGQPTGVGFLITAKSILRFGDAHEPNNRKLAEDIIIGTFLSFGWGMAIAELTSLALNHWFPRT